MATETKNQGPLGPEPPPPGATPAHAPRPMSRGIAIAQGEAAPASQATHIEGRRAIAEVQAMVVVAQQAPRDQTKALERIMQSCRMKELAECAFFRFPRGGQQISGPSIHLAVELARCWGNITYGVSELDRDDAKARSEMTAFAWDLETNTRPSTTFIVPHKRDKKGGMETLTDMRDIYENNANMGARRVREMIFRVLPPWLIAKAEAACRATLEDGGGEPLPVRIVAALDKFAKIGVSRERIEARIGRPVDGISAVELANIGIIYKSIERGEVRADDEFPPVMTAKLNAAISPTNTQSGAGSPSPTASDGGAGEGTLKPHDPAPPPSRKIAVVSVNGRTDWQGFADAMLAAIERAGDTEELAAIDSGNAANLQAAPPVFRRAIREAIEKRGAAITAGKP